IGRAVISHPVAMWNESVSAPATQAKTILNEGGYVGKNDPPASAPHLLRVIHGYERSHPYVPGSLAEGAGNQNGPSPSGADLAPFGGRPDARGLLFSRTFAGRCGRERHRLFGGSRVGGRKAYQVHSRGLRREGRP